jgi:DNA-nicking Smr family endonuclease
VKEPALKVRKLGGFAELEVLARALEAAHERAQRLASKALELEAHAAQQRNLFARSVGPVTPLRKAATAAPARVRPAAVARQRERDEAQVLRQSLSDDFDADWLLETDDTLSFRRAGVGNDVVRRLRRGVWVTQAQLDLHGLRRDEARQQLVGFLRDAAQTGRRCVRVIHGKGNGSPGRQGVLKDKVKGWLMQRDDVIAFTQARAADGGVGALLVLLRAGKGS